MSLIATLNTALADEIEAITSIFELDTISIISIDPSSTTVVHLKLPAQPFTFLLSFPNDYPDTPPRITGTASTGDTERGAGDAALKIVRDVLQHVYQPGAVCLFELITDAGPLLAASYGTHAEKVEQESQELSTAEAEQPLTSARQQESESALSLISEGKRERTVPPPPPTPIPTPQWMSSNSLTVSKSTFIAHAAPCSSREEALSHISSLGSSNRKIAAATHNITAYRVRVGRPKENNDTFVQDCDDDGESAAGGRLLRLLQPMECEDVVVVVTRWYGGVKLGGERFRCIGQVAREALLRGGWGKDKEHGKRR